MPRKILTIVLSADTIAIAGNYEIPEAATFKRVLAVGTVINLGEEYHEIL